MRKISFVFALFLTGCYKPANTLPPSIFEQVKRVERPDIKTLEDIQKSYIYLFEAYETNLNLLKLLENAK